MSNEAPQYRYRVSGRRAAHKDGMVIVLEGWASDEHDAQDRAAYQRRWGWEAWVERQLIVPPVEPPPWERV